MQRVFLLYALSFTLSALSLIIHSTHSWCAAPGCECGSSFLGLSATTHSVVNNIPAIEAAFSKSNTGNFCWIDNTSFEKVFIHFSAGIKTKITFSFFYFLNNDTSFDTAIVNDLAKRFFDSTFNNLDTGCFIFVSTL